MPLTLSSYTQVAALPVTPGAAEKAASTLERPAPDSRAGCGDRDLISHPRTKACPWCPTAVYKVLSRRTPPLAKTVACQGSTSTYTACILATITSKGRNTAGVCLVVKRALPPGTRSTALPWACGSARTAPAQGGPAAARRRMDEVAAAASHRAARRAPPAALALLPTAAWAPRAVVPLAQS